MAELAVIGAAASILQLIDLSAKVGARLKEFSASLGRLPNSFEHLQNALRLLPPLLCQIATINQGHQLDSGLQHVVESCLALIQSLEKDIDKILPSAGDSSTRRKWKAVRSLGTERAMQVTLERLNGYLSVLNFYQEVRNGGRLQTILSAVAKAPEQLGYHLMVTIAEPPALVTQDYESNVQDATNLQIRPMAIRASPRWPPRHRDPLSLRNLCLDDRCTCTCHHRIYSSGQCWSWSISTLGSLFVPCNRATCRNRVFRARCSVSLWPCHILWSLHFGFDIAWCRYSCTISANLQPERIVPFDSPGFSLLQKLVYRPRKLPEAKEALQKLFDEGQASPFDVDPAGNTWLEKLISEPFLWTELKLGLLEFLLQQGASCDTKHSLIWLWLDDSNLPRPPQCSVRLEDTLFRNGYDASLANSYSLTKWSMLGPVFPLPALPWRGDDRKDSYYLRVLVKCVDNYPEFGGTTSLMAAVLDNDEEGALKLAGRSNALSARNFLGQSALHLSVIYPKLLARLLAYHKDLGLEMLDNVGATPLIYAACYGKADSIISLLRAGANPSIKDRKYRFGFVDCAIVTGYTNVLGKIVEEIKKFYSATDFRNILNSILRSLMRNGHSHNVHKRCDYLRQFLSYGGDANTTYGDNSTLLYHVREDEELEVLFEYGFDQINHADDYGNFPLMRHVQHRRSHIVRKCLRNGASVLTQDARGWTAMHHATNQMDFRHYDDYREYAHGIAPILELLEYGADPRTTDHCRCSCGVDGCSPSTILANSIGDLPAASSVRVLDWLLLIQERTPELLFKEVLMQALRAMRFRNAGLTHVCCRRRMCEEAEISDIFDAEKVEIQELDESLETLTCLDPSSLMEALIQEQAQHCYNVRHVVTDLAKGDFGPDNDVNYIDAYLDRLNRCYQAPQYPQFDQQWRGKRMYWILRFRDAIQERFRWTSESTDRVGDSKILPEWHDIDLGNSFYGVDVCLTILRLMWGHVPMRCLVVLGLYVVIEMVYQGW